MKSRSNVNWLVLITLCLTIAAFSMFFFSIKDGIGLKKCVFSETSISGSDDCYCDENGEVVCKDGVGGELSDKVLPSEFTAEKLAYSYDFLNYIENSSTLNSDIVFADISNIESNLKITVEKKSLCNEDQNPAPQSAFYKLYEDSLVITIGSNLVDPSFNTPCVTEGIFNIFNLKSSFPQDFKIYYQDEFDVLTSANSCVYEGFLRNEGDTYQSLDGCALCTCSQGLNKCELENSCLQ